MTEATTPAVGGLRIDHDGPVISVTFARPKARNALTRAMVDGLARLFEHLAATRDARVVVLRGEGGTFCAGGDVADMARGAAGASPTEAAARMRETNRAFGAMLEVVRAAPVTTVAVVEGVALGGGFGLACATDVTLAHEDAVFGMPETRLGIPPAQIAPFVVQRIGAGATRFLAVTGRRIDARRAREIGAVHVVTDDVDRALADLLDDALRCAPGAVSTTKRLVDQATAGPLSDVLDAAADAFVEAARGSEAREGMAAFLAKRPPSWSRGG